MIQPAPMRALCALLLCALLHLTVGKMRGCGPNALFCEDFENVSVITKNTTDWYLQGAAAIRAGALHLTPQGGKYGRMSLKRFSPPDNSFYGRIYVRVEKFPTAPNYAHWLLVEAHGRKGERVRPLNGQLINEVGLNMWGVGADGGPTGDWTAWRESAPTEEGVWTCVEWRMLQADSSVRVWLDETPMHNLTVSRGSHGGKNATNFEFPKFDSIWFGWWVFQGETTPARFNVSIDNIVLSTERIYC